MATRSAWRRVSPNRVEPERRRHGLDVQAAPGRQVAARRVAVHGGRRRGNDGTARRGGQLGSQGRPRPRRRRRDRRHDRDDDPRGRQRELPVSRLDLQLADGHHPGRRIAAGTTADARPTGTGAWKLESYDQQTGANVRAERRTWWGGQTPLDTTEFIFFDDTGSMVTAYQGDQVDAIVQFDVLSGAALFDDPELHAHRRSRRRSTGRSGCAPTRVTFADQKVREALALTWDREALVRSCSTAAPQVGNDHVIWQDYPYFDGTVAAADPRRRAGQGVARRSGCRRA